MAGDEERTPEGLTEDKPLLGPIVFIPLLIVIALALFIGAWAFM
jgi:hypothetical protein